jgi:hypothetical protein
MISIGGGGAARFIPDDQQSAKTLSKALYTYITQYGYDGIDIDEENTVPVTSYVNFLNILSVLVKTASPTALVSPNSVYCFLQFRGELHNWTPFLLLRYSCGLWHEYHW